MELKPGYKQTDVGVLAEDWEVKPLGKLLGRSPAYGINAPAVPFDTRLPTYLRITDITQDGRFTQVDKASVNHPFAENYILEPGDVVFARTGASVGKSYRYRNSDGKLVFAGFLIRVRPGTDVLDSAYLSFFVQSRTYWNWVRVNSMRSGQPGINGREYASLPIPLPPTKAEQEAIAEALSDADALIESLEQLVAKKRQTKHGAMQELLTGNKRLPGFSGNWETYRFDEVFTVLRNASNSRSELSEHGEVAYVHYGDIHMHPTAFLNPTTNTYISRAKVRTIPRLADGDILMADASEDTTAIGKAVEIVGLGGREAVAGLHTMFLRGDKERLADGFKGYLQFLPQVRVALVRLATGVSVYGITKSGVKAIEITIPEPAEQTAIAAILSDMDAEIALLEAKLSKARHIKQGMMQELLTGRIRLV